MKGVRYISYRGPGGYGEAARRTMRALEGAGAALTWTPMVDGRGWGSWHQPARGPSVGDPEFDRLCNRRLACDVAVIHTVPEYFPPWRRKLPGVKLFGSFAWETDRLPRHWPPLLESVDELIVPCEWNRQVARACGVTRPIHVVPHPPPGPSAEPGPIPVADHGEYVFYSIGDWSHRKAIDLLVRTYLDHFRGDEAVHLVLKTSAHDGTVRLPRGLGWPTRWTLRRLVGLRRRSPRITLLAGPVGEQVIAGLHQRGDCYVSLTRGEGWGLGAFDAAAAGKPVIMTGYGGQRDFLPEPHADLVGYRLVPVRAGRGSTSYTPDQRWAEPDLEDAACRMRAACRDPAGATRRGAGLRAHVEGHFDAAAIGARLRGLLSRQ